MGFKAKRFGKNVARPFKAAKRIGSAIGGAIRGRAADVGEYATGLGKYTEARARAAGSGVVNFVEEGWR